MWGRGEGCSSAAPAPLGAPLHRSKTRTNEQGENERTKAGRHGRDRDKTQGRSLSPYRSVSKVLKYMTWIAEGMQVAVLRCCARRVGVLIGTSSIRNSHLLPAQKMPMTRVTLRLNSVDKESSFCVSFVYPNDLYRSQHKLTNRNEF